MKASTLWTQLVSTIKESPILSVYVKQVFEGRRYDIEPESLPCIMLDPVRDGEIERRTGNVHNVYFTVNVYAFCNSNSNEFSKTIVGDDIYKGVLDVHNDLRACLISSNTLGDRCIDLLIEPVEFDTIEDKYTVRGLLMPIRILYRQQDGV